MSFVAAAIEKDYRRESSGNSRHYEYNAALLHCRASRTAVFGRWPFVVGRETVNSVSQRPTTDDHMRKAMLLYNPLSGRGRERRLADVEAARSVLQGAGVEATSAPTRAPSDATDQSKLAIADGCDTIFACGGDGTVHDVLQGLVGTETALGIIPLGTANSLAHDLGLPLAPAAAARAALNAERRRIAVGRIEYQDFFGNRALRYFTVTAGIGVDAYLFYKLDPFIKRSFGMAAYCAKATHLWLTHKMENFSVEFENEGGSHQAAVSQLLAVRINNFGGVLRELAPGASLERDDLRLVLFRTQSRVKYLRYVLRGLFGADWKIPGIDLVYSASAVCQDAVASSGKPRILVEADGELLGSLPAAISMVPDALTILMPDPHERERPR
jgi:diacylglycerol kinase (ATP)